jgi:AraC-like DNA-binding protein
MLIDKLISHLVVEVKPFAVCQVSNGWRLRLPGPADIMLHFVLKGGGTIHCPKGGKHHLSPYSLCIVPKGLAHFLEPHGSIADELCIDSPPPDNQVYHIVAGPEGESGMVLSCGLIKVKLAESLGLFDHLKEILTIDFSDAPHVKDIFAAIVNEQTQSLNGSEAMTAALMTGCLVHLLRRITKQDGTSIPWLLALEDTRLGQAIDEILEDPTAPHTVESLANAASMSRSAFAEKFTVSFGHSPMQFVHQLRMLQAAKFLIEDRHSIDQIAHKVGYLSRSHFSEAFKKQYGQSPAAFRVA